MGGGEGQVGGAEKWRDMLKGGRGREGEVEMGGTPTGTKCSQQSWVVTHILLHFDLLELGEL